MSLLKKWMHEQTRYFEPDYVESVLGGWWIFPGENTIKVNAQSVSDDVDGEEHQVGHRIPAVPVRPPFPEMWIEYRVGEVQVGWMVWDRSIVNRVTALLVSQGPDGKAYAVGVITFALNEDGTASIEQAKVKGGVLNKGLRYKPMAAAAEGMETPWWTISVLIHTLARFNCKNVTIQQRRDTDTRPRKNGKQPRGTVWHEIVVRPISYRSTGNLRGSPGAVRMHMCRGHYAVYTQDKPLFGKITGTFWVPPHVRGSNAIGEVKQTYRIASAQ